MPHFEDVFLTEDPTSSSSSSNRSATPETSSSGWLLQRAGEFLCDRVFPDWSIQDLKLERCTEGITNKLVRATHLPSQEVVLVRIYGHGTDSIIDRRAELQTMSRLAALGFAPPLFCTFANGFCYGFLPGRVLLPQELSSFYPLLAHKLARFHRIPAPGSAMVVPRDQTAWHTMLQWLTKVPLRYQDDKQQARYTSHAILQPSVIKGELEMLRRAVLAHTDSPIVFCHNDLLAANIIFHDPSNSTPSPGQIISEGSVYFIDFEYGSFNHRGFDIANHFNEYAGFECDYSRYPDRTQQMKWFGVYLSTFNEMEPCQTEVDQLFEEVEQYSLVSHFFWAIWALVQASFSDIDFDYLSYAVLRFNQYYKRRDNILKIKSSS